MPPAVKDPEDGDGLYSVVSVCPEEHESNTMGTLKLCVPAGMLEKDIVEDVEEWVWKS